MTALSLASTVLLPFGLGLVGLVEPCTIGSSLIFVKHMEGRTTGGKLAEASLFAITRAPFIAPTRRALDWIAGLSRQVPCWTGIVLIALGLWSVWFGLFVKLGPPA